MRSRPAPPDVALRTATASDQIEIGGLAGRAGEPVPDAPLVVAAVDGRVVAVTSRRTGVVLFEPAADADVRAALRAYARRG
ncbi:hypothetical protein [Patulibacter defluvii]|uniref:hypothetical protein n=1 Tax=Patulibacter defluvii TaxID=3095358 RepID=UPI002A7663E9|nr:hypothetical protein [Patulibacter sp. DM4]